MTKVTYINPPGLRGSPAFSHVALCEPGRLAFIAGQTATALDGTTISPDDIAGQTRAVFANLELALAAVGADFASVCEFTTYLVGAEHRPGFQKARAEVFGRIYQNGPCPPNTLLVIAGLARPDLLLEISAIARVP